jgi:hypothetical protein
VIAVADILSMLGASRRRNRVAQLFERPHHLFGVRLIASSTDAVGENLTGHVKAFLPIAVYLLLGQKLS